MGVANAFEELPRLAVVGVPVAVRLHALVRDDAAAVDRHSVSTERTQSGSAAIEHARSDRDSRPETIRARNRSPAHWHSQCLEVIVRRHLGGRMSVLSRRLGLAILLAAACLVAQTAQAQVNPLTYWTPGWPIGFSSNTAAGLTSETYGNFPGIEATDANG